MTKTALDYDDTNNICPHCGSMLASHGEAGQDALIVALHEMEFHPEKVDWGAFNENP